MKEKLMKYKKAIPYAAVFLFMIFAALYFYYGEVVYVARGDSGKYFVREADTKARVLLSEEELVQTYTPSRDHIGKIGLSFVAEGDVKELTLYGELREKGGKTLKRWEIGAEKLDPSRGGFDYFFLDDRLVGKGNTLEIVLSVRGEAKGSLSVCCAGEKEQSYGELSGKAYEGTENLALLVYGPVQYLGKIFAAVAAGFLFLTGIVLWLTRDKKRVRLENIFLLTGFVLGSVYLFLFTPGTEPDGKAHSISAYYYADILTGREALDEEGKVLARADDVKGDGYSDYLGLDNINTTKERIFSKAENSEPEAFFRGPLSSPPTAHIPQILGTAVGLGLGLSAAATLYLGKIFAFLFYLACGYLAIRLMPFGKILLFMTALLPFSLETGTSHSYDCTVLGLSLVMTGYAFYLRDIQKRIRLRDAAAWILLTVWISPCKIVYIFLALLIFLAPKEKFRKKQYYWLLGAGSFGAGLLSLLASRMAMITSTVSGGEGKYVTIGEFLGDLKNAFLMICRTLDIYMDEYLQQIFGGVYSWFDIELAWTFVLAYVLLFCGAALAVQGERNPVNGREKLWLGFISLMIIAAVAASMLFSWTPSGTNFIAGIQGRYVLPILPLVGLLFRNKLLTFQKNVDRQLIIGMICAQYMTVMQLFVTVVYR